MDEEVRVLSYIIRFRQLADLKSMNVKVEDEDIAMSILCGLPGFEHLIVEIDTMTGETSLTLDFVKSRLLQEEQRIDDCGATPLRPDAALVIKPLKNRKCTYCKRKRHTEPY